MMDGSSCAASEPFALRVLGSSMEPEFPEGSIIIIDPGGLVKDGCYVLAADANKELIFRQLLIKEDDYFLTAIEKGHGMLRLVDKDAIKGVISQRAGPRRKDHKSYE